MGWAKFRGIQNRYDGEVKNYTGDCEGCKFHKQTKISGYKEINKGIINLDACGWGVAWKFLYKKEPLQKCTLLKKSKDEIPHHQSIKRLTELEMKKKYRENHSKYEVNLIRQLTIFYIR